MRLHRLVRQNIGLLHKSYVICAFKKLKIFKLGMLRNIRIWKTEQSSNYVSFEVIFHLQCTYYFLNSFFTSIFKYTSILNESKSKNRTYKLNKRKLYLDHSTWLIFSHAYLIHTFAIIPQPGSIQFFHPLQCLYHSI